MKRIFKCNTNQILNTLVHLPNNYDKTKKYPLILFLHGSGESGDDIKSLHHIQSNWPLGYETIKQYEFILIAPQCPKKYDWPILGKDLDNLLDQVCNEYAVDQKRIYLTGLSMGGYGAWYMGFIYPERFAAIVPICGGGIITSETVLKDIPIWAFHGRKDDVVPVDETVSLANKIKALNGNIKVTIYDDVGHDAWVNAYQDEALYTWLFKQKKL